MKRNVELASFPFFLGLIVKERPLFCIISPSQDHKTSRSSYMSFHSTFLSCLSFLRTLLFTSFCPFLLQMTLRLLIALLAGILLLPATPFSQIDSCKSRGLSTNHQCTLLTGGAVKCFGRADGRIGSGGTNHLGFTLDKSLILHLNTSFLF